MGVLPGVAAQHRTLAVVTKPGVQGMNRIKCARHEYRRVQIDAGHEVSNMGYDMQSVGHEVQSFGYRTKCKQSNHPFISSHPNAK